MPRPANDPLRRSMETYRRRRPRAPTTRDRLVATGSRLALMSAISLVFAGVLVLGASVGHHAAGSAGGQSAAGLPRAGRDPRRHRPRRPTSTRPPRPPPSPHPWHTTPSASTSPTAPTLAWSR